MSRRTRRPLCSSSIGYIGTNGMVGGHQLRTLIRACRFNHVGCGSAFDIESHPGLQGMASVKVEQEWAHLTNMRYSFESRNRYAYSYFLHALTITRLLPQTPSQLHSSAQLHAGHARCNGHQERLHSRAAGVVWRGKVESPSTETAIHHPTVTLMITSSLLLPSCNFPLLLPSFESLLV